jgi:hypothetical protein
MDIAGPGMADPGDLGAAIECAARTKPHFKRPMECRNTASTATGTM